MTAAAPVTSDFIRRAVELGDLDAVRVALYQQTGDAALESLPVAAKLSAEQRAGLIDKAVAWLEQNQGGNAPAEPEEAELRRLMNMAIGSAEGMGDLEFAARRDLPAFKEFPYKADWCGVKPAIPEGFTVAVIGSGFAGVEMGVQLDMLGIPYTVYERRSEAGGVWSINRYPDVRVDTSSLTYEFNFEKEHIWSEYFGRGPEVRAYIDQVSRKRGVHANTRFDHDLTAATFDEARDRWVMEFATPDGPETVEANVIVSCSGLFATPNLPHFEGQEDFQGRLVHPSRWPDDLDLAGKRVAVIGNGSTGVQMLGAIARQADKAYAFQRTPQWISPRDKYGEAIEPEVQWLMRNMPGYWNWSRFTATAPLFDTHGLMTVDPDWQAKGGKVNAASDAMRDFLTGYIRQETGGRQDLIDKLIPDYAPLSRRPVVDNGWYRALTRDNVELVTQGIAKLVPEGIETVDGKIRELDVIVAATGFEVQKYLWPARYTGVGGADLHDGWDQADGARAYIGMMHPGFPNLYTIYGPNSQPLSGGPAQPVWFAVWCAFAAQGIMHLLEKDASRIDVKRDAYDRYNAAVDLEAKKLVQMTVEGGIEKNYYVNNKGEESRLQVNAPWYSPYYHHLCSNVDWDDMEVSGVLAGVERASA